MPWQSILYPIALFITTIIAATLVFYAWRRRSASGAIPFALPMMTERKQVEAALRESQERFRRLTEAAFEGLVIHDQGRILEANQTLATMFGYELSDLIGKSTLELALPEYRDLVWQNILTQSERPYESVGLRKDGTTFDIEVIGKPLPYQGQMVRVVAIRDISESKQIEQALQESEERLRQVLSSISDHIYVTEITQAGQRINHYLSPVEQLTGYPITRLLADWSFWPSTLIHPDDRAAAAAQAEKFARGENSEVEYRLIRADGQIIWVRDSGRVEQDPLSQSIFVYGVVSDITRRKQAEEALRQSEERFRYLVENAGDDFFVHDMEGGFVEVNERACQNLGYTREELLSMSVPDVDPDWEYERMTAVIKQLPLGLPVTAEGNERRKDGTILPVEVRFVKLEFGGRHLVLALARDITERKRIAEALAHARDQALETSHLKSQLLAKVSHELRTPLGAILGYTELLKNGVFGSLTDQQSQVAAEVIDSTHYLTNLVNELLDQAQFETGKVHLIIGPFAVSQITKQVEARLSVLAQAKGLTLITEIAPELPEILSGDATRIQQILVNLVSNAIKFTKAGAVQVRFYRPAPDRWAMQVSDTGTGIPQEAQAYIFEPFRQVDGSMTREYIGTGLGLSIVKQLTTLMGGQVSLESEVGQGSTFTVVLPLEPVQEKLHDQSISFNH